MIAIATRSSVSATGLLIEFIDDEKEIVIKLIIAECEQKQEIVGCQKGQ